MVVDQLQVKVVVKSSYLSKTKTNFVFFFFCTQEYFRLHFGVLMSLSLDFNAATRKNPIMARLRIGVIGAGAAGLSAVKHALDFGCDVMAFEKNDEIGGTWIYTDDVGKDQHGLELFSGMYQGLMSNTPKEIMSFPDFPYPATENSFLKSSEVLEYFKIYAEKFKLRQYIKLEHHVQNVRPQSDATWEISVTNLRDKKMEIYIFDAVFVCSGLTRPTVPKIQGQHIFSGKKVFQVSRRMSTCNSNFINRHATALPRLQKSSRIREQKGSGHRCRTQRHRHCN